MNETNFDTKRRALEVLHHHYVEQHDMVAAIEPRLTEYFDGLCAEVTDKGDALPDDPQPHHNMYELLGAVKFLRLLRTYEFNHRKVKQVVWLREGDWHQESDGRWIHDGGGLKCPGTDTAHVYRWQPFQVFVLASIFGFQSWVNTQVAATTKPELLKTERAREDGYIEDLRRLCNYFVYYGPRKTDKTGLSAYVQLIFFLMEDYNAEVYCCAMSEQQAKILFNRAKFMLTQLNEENQWRMTEKVVDWKPQYRSVRNTSIMPLTAGGKAKDGAFAALVNFDEFGSSPYVNGKSDMASLINVMRSSMGPRREPLTFGTTTAGTITSGPFMEMLDGLHDTLLKELDYEEGKDIPSFSGDRSLCLLLEPDAEERREEEYMMTSQNLRSKVNPMLGITCQHQFYDDSLEDVRTGKMTKGEYIAKLINVYQNTRVTKWLTGDQVRERQVERRITDCKFSEGWNVYVGFDFGGTDDLFGMAFLAVNYAPDVPNTERRFADCVAWITESALNASPNKTLYEQWVAQGYLKVCPGQVFDPTYAINEMIELGNHGINMVKFGYDPAQSRMPVNTIKAWLQSLGKDAQTIKQMVVPVPQTFLATNGLVQELEYLILDSRAWLKLSPSPLWPWQFGNCMMEVTTAGLRRPIKSTHNAKVDCVHALIDTLFCFDLDEGQLVI